MARTAESILEQVEAARRAYTAEARRVNSDRRLSLQGRQEALDAAWAKVETEVRQLREDYEAAVATGRAQVRRRMVNPGVDPAAVRAALAELEGAGPDDFARAVQLAEDLDDKAMRTALAYRASEDRRLLELLPERERDRAADVIEYEREFGSLRDAHQKFAQRVALSAPAKVAPEPPAPANEVIHGAGSGFGPLTIH